jgi:hypothetical protein
MNKQAHIGMAIFSPYFAPYSLDWYLNKFNIRITAYLEIFNSMPQMMHPLKKRKRVKEVKYFLNMERK